MTINDDFQAFVQQRATELAGAKTGQQTAYERQERLAAEGGELFTGLFAQLDAQTAIDGEPVANATPADPAENDFNNLFGL